MHTATDTAAPPRPRLGPDELGLPRDVYDALVWVRDALDPLTPEVTMPDWMVFDMATWPTHIPWMCSRKSEASCGTPLCIGGSMNAYLAGLDELAEAGDGYTSELVQRSSDHSDRLQAIPELQALFFCYPEHIWLGPSLAVRAIDALFGGNTTDPWSEVDPRVPAGS